LRPAKAWPDQRSAENTLKPHSEGLERPNVVMHNELEVRKPSEGKAATGRPNKCGAQKSRSGIGANRGFEEML
jgi:hypothetical protein